MKKRIWALTVLTVSFGFLGFGRENTSSRSAFPILTEIRSLTADGGEPPAPPIPIPTSKDLLTADGGEPPAPPIPIPTTDSVLTADGGEPPAPPIPWVYA